MHIDRFLASHDGVVSRDQARGCGLSEDQIAGRVSRGEWLRRASAVYFAVAWAWTPAARVRVAGEWAAPVGALAGLAAAWWLGLGVDGPHPITVVLPRGCSRRPPPGIRVVQRDLRGDRLLHRGLWVVTRPLAVLDAAVALGSGGPPFLDRALQQHVSLDELRTVQSRHLGRRGSAAAGKLIARAGDRAASEAERRMIALLRGAGLTGWTVNLTVAVGGGSEVVIDIAFPGVRLALEVDGWAHHVDHARFVGDRVRKRTLVAAGWTVAEVTWEDLERRPAEVLDQIRRALLHLSARAQ